MRYQSANFMDATTEVPDTYYAVTALPHGPRPRLTQDVDTGVCIIGGGLAGLWIARALLQRNHDVVVLEADRVGSGASGRSGGFVSAGYAQELESIVERVGLEHARALYQLSRDGVEIVRELLAQGELKLDAVPGRLSVRRYDDEAGAKREAAMFADKFDHDMVLWPTERVRETLKTTRYYQALHDADAFHLHPLNLAIALANDVEKRGGRIYEQSAAIAADLDGVRKWVATSAGRVRAHQVVFCGSAFIGAAFPKLKRTVLPVATHVAVTAPLGRYLHEVIGYSGAISDTRRAFDYYRILGDRLMWGGYISTRTKKPRNLARRFQRDIANIYPQLEGTRIDYAWTGIMGYAVHRMPQLGLLRSGVWIASAFGGQGLNTTAIAGELIGSAIAENDERWRLFVPFGMVSAGGIAGRTLVQIVYWGAEARDALDERTAEWKKRWRVWQRKRRALAAARKREKARAAKIRAAERKAADDRAEGARRARDEAELIAGALRVKPEAEALEEKPDQPAPAEAEPQVAKKKKKKPKEKKDEVEA
jgi:glycine/D-amino acid oxidase-like deaminating enzyme